LAAGTLFASRRVVTLDMRAPVGHNLLWLTTDWDVVLYRYTLSGACSVQTPEQESKENHTGIFLFLGKNYPGCRIEAAKVFDRACGTRCPGIKGNI
jgi:hypothetical protein